MTNEQLVTLFREVDLESNCFSRDEKLRAAKKQYKQSDYYKHTKQPIQKAYALYKLNALQKLTNLVNNQVVAAICDGEWDYIMELIEYRLRTFDTSSLDKIFNYINEKVTQIDLPALSDQLNETIKEFTDSLK